MPEFMRLLWLIAFEVAAVALIALCDAMLPGLTGRAREAVAAMPVRAFLVGLINLAFFGLVCAVLFSLKGIAGAIGLVLALAVLSLGTLGLTVAARLVAARLYPAAPGTLRSLLGATTILALASSVPFVGWFVVLPIALCTGTGATIIALVRRRAATVSPVAATTPPAWSWPPPPQPPNAGGSTSGSG
jgi:hypothetical protein